MPEVYGVRGHLVAPFGLCITEARILSTLAALSQTCSHCMLDSNRAGPYPAYNLNGQVFYAQPRNLGGLVHALAEFILVFLHIRRFLLAPSCQGIHEALGWLTDKCEAVRMNQLLIVRGNGSRPEKGGLYFSDWRRIPASSGEVQVSLGPVHE